MIGPYDTEVFESFTSAVGEAARGWVPTTDTYPIAGGETAYIEMSHRLTAVVQKNNPGLPRDLSFDINAHLGLEVMSLFMYRCAYRAALASLTVEQTAERLRDQRTAQTLHHIASQGNSVAAAVESVYGLQEPPFFDDEVEQLGIPRHLNDLVVTSTHFRNPSLTRVTQESREYLSKELGLKPDQLKPAMCPMQATRQILPCFRHIVTIGQADPALIQATLATYTPRH